MPAQPGSRAEGRNKPADTDQLDISGITGRIAETLDSQAGSHAQHVEALRAAVQAGTYQVDSQALSRTLIDHALSAD
jgi:anti-sigma28 factor (negative regulator of flagellin synthesis)